MFIFTGIDVTLEVNLSLESGGPPLDLSILTWWPTPFDAPATGRPGDSWPPMPVFDGERQVIDGERQVNGKACGLGEAFCITSWR
jgi:hypothetical protein